MMFMRPYQPGMPPRYSVLYDPISLASLALTAVSGIVGAAGSVMQGRSQASAASYQAAVASNNQKIAGQNATYALQAGQQREQAARMRTAGLIGSQRATAAAHGVDVNSGSALDVQSDAATLGELDALTIRNNAAREAYNYKVQGMNYGAESGLLGYSASEDTMGGWAKGFSSLVGAASSFGDKWQSFSEQGLDPFATASPMGSH